MSAFEDQLRRAFKTYNYAFKDEGALEACVRLAQEFSLSAEKIAFDYELLNSTKEDASNEVTAGQLESKAFRDMLVKQYANKPQPPRTATKLPLRASLSEREQQQFQPTPKRQATGTPATGLKPSLGASTPASNGVHTPNGRTPSTNSKYASRTNSRQITQVLNDSVAPISRPADPSSPACSIQALGPQMPPIRQHLYMMEPLETKVHAIDERITDWCDALKAVLPKEEAGSVDTLSVGDAAQDPVWVVGRVILEGGGEGEQGVFLEGNLRGSEGERVRMDLSALTSATPGPACRLFPGQIVAVRGTNPTGECIMARQLCAHLPAPAPSAPSDGPCSMVVAAGPFTPGDELTYALLDDLLQYCSEKLPDLLLLLGPFVDAKHPAVENGNLDTTFEGLFREEVLQRLAAWSSQHPHTRITLVPSTRDAHHAPVFPTPSFVLSPSLGAGASPSPAQGAGSTPITCLQNPCTFAAGSSLVAGVCSSDSLKALAGSEQAKGGAPGQDRIGALASHILGQRSYFPVYPAPLGTCLDLSASHYLTLPCTPHLLLLASDLAPFAKLVSPQPPQQPAQPQHQAQSPQQPQSPEQQQQQQQQQQQPPLPSQPHVASAPARVVCLNPGRLAKGGAGGTFAHVYAQAGQGPVSERCRVEIMRV